MLCRVLQASRLLHKQSAPMFIYLRDHNKLINPELSKLNLSYSHPKNLVPDAPVHTPINFKLDPEMEVLLERQIFEEYKNKVLQGVIDEVEEVTQLICRYNQTLCGAKNQCLFTTSAGSAKLTSWQYHTHNDLTLKIASIKSTVPISQQHSKEKSLKRAF